MVVDVVEKDNRDDADVAAETVNHLECNFQPLPPLLEGSGDIQQKSDDFAKNSKKANVYTTANKDKVLVRKQDEAEDRKFYNPFKSPYPTSKTPPMATKKPFKPPFPAVPGESTGENMVADKSMISMKMLPPIK